MLTGPPAVCVFSHARPRGRGRTRFPNYLDVMWLTHAVGLDRAHKPNNLRIGYQFLWGIERPYTVDEGKVLLKVQLPDPTCVQELEAQRTSLLLTGFLRLHYGNKNYKITASSGRNSIRYCQFSGGSRDIEISKDPTKSRTVNPLPPCSVSLCMPALFIYT